MKQSMGLGNMASLRVVTTSISHNSSYFATNLPGYTWEQVGFVVSIDNPQRAYATATGRVTHGTYVGTFSGYSFGSFGNLIGS